MFESNDYNRLIIVLKYKGSHDDTFLPEINVLSKRKLCKRLAGNHMSTPHTDKHTELGCAPVSFDLD